MFSNTAGSLFSSNTMSTAPNRFLTPGTTTEQAPSANPNNDFEVPSPPEDTVSALRFCPIVDSTTGYLASSSWDGLLRVWQISSQPSATGGGGENVLPKAQQNLPAPLMDCCWSADGTKIFGACADNNGYMWDVASNQMQQFAAHTEAIKTVHWIQAPNYNCVMTGSWDRSLKFWDLRSQQPILTLQVPERIYCAAVHYPLAVVALANRQVAIYNLENQPSEHSIVESALKFQSSSLDIFLDKMTQKPNGFALGCIEGRVSIQYLNTTATAKENFTFKCHRTPVSNVNQQDIYPVNDIAFHPVHGTLATVGSDGRYTFWDKDAQTKLKQSEQIDQPLTSCTFDSQGILFAYAAGYDWSKGYEGNDPGKTPKIYLKLAMEALKPSQKKN